MKILIMGDFHGKFSKKLEVMVKREKPDFILSPGDFCGDETLAKFFFDRIYGREEDEVSLEDMLIYQVLEKVSLKKGVDLVRRLKKLKTPFFSIRGNWDPAPFGNDIVGELDEEDLRKINIFEGLETQKFSFMDLKLKEFESFVLVGGASSTSPQRRDGKKGENIRVLKKNWNIRQKLYDKNFKKALEIKKKTGKKIVFLTHNCPYNTKLDKVKKGPVKGKHYGSYQERLAIRKYKPDLVFCGHMHENFGKDKIGKSVIYNVGSAMDGKFLVMKI